MASGNALDALEATDAPVNACQIKVIIGSAFPLPGLRRVPACAGSQLALGKERSTWEWKSVRRSALPSVLPRKEVIQPHLPVRLPCYDFTPITDPTLDACPPCGLAQRLQVSPTFVV